MEIYGTIRRAVQAEEMSEREAVRQFGIARETVRKIPRCSTPPGYWRNKPVQWPKKQRHRARRICDRLKEEHGFTGGYTIVKDHVRQARLRHKEVFVPLTHPPG